MVGCQNLLGLEHGLDNSRIGPATAEVAAHAFAYAFWIITGLPFLDQADRADDLARRAESALEAVMSDEGDLDGMEFVAASDALDRQDFGAVVADRQCQARVDPSSVDQDRNTRRIGRGRIPSWFPSGRDAHAADQGG